MNSRNEIKNVSVKQAFKACDKYLNHIIIDVRTAIECSQGVALGAHCIELSDLKEQHTQLDKNNHYYVMCQTGIRSASAIQQLLVQGFKNLNHIHAGFVDWQEQNLPTEIPSIKDEDIRYSRHHQLQGFGKSGQENLKSSHVLLIGAGGLGSSSGLYLAAAGVGEITIIDDDVVELSNLQRQIIHNTDSIGKAKADSAGQNLSRLNPHIKINAIAQRFNAENCEKMIESADVVIDGSDNLQTRYLVNDICLKYKKPLIYAAVYQYEAQISVFDFREAESPCLRCLFPQTEGFEPENCSTVGVLGVVPGLAGVLQATEAIKIIANIGEILTSRLLIIDLLDMCFRTINYSKNHKCKFHDLDF
jgi:molybdopterin/thiamine biosynthesis adenylyltransferase/rhodanese-related sulfurtransferase